MVEWREIEGFPGYLVSSEGEVYSLKSNRVLIGSIDKDGYHSVKLMYPSRNWYRTLKVHRLVAEAFIGPIGDGFEVNHIDYNKQNNKVENLEIVTHLQNMHHSMENIRKGQIKRWQKRRALCKAI